MEIRYHGGNCISLIAKKVTVVIDDNLLALGGRNFSGSADISIYTQKRFNDGKSKGFVIDGQGEYEVSEVSVIGFSTRAHTDHEGEKTATIYKIMTRGITVCVLGHIDPTLSDEQLEKLGTLDVLIIPVGGAGYTLDGKSAAKLVRDIEPKIIIPTHYQEAGINYEVPQAPVEEFFKEIGATPEKVESLKLKTETLPIDTQSFYQLEKIN